MMDEIVVLADHIAVPVNDICPVVCVALLDLEEHTLTVDIHGTLTVMDIHHGTVVETKSAPDPRGIIDLETLYGACL